VTPPKPSNSIPEDDAAAYIGMTVAYLRKARQQGRGPTYLRLGRSIRYRTPDLDAWLEKHVVRTRESA
jgi:predicted DNA-binding transcriptional regulator AlpA